MRHVCRRGGVQIRAIEIGKLADPEEAETTLHLVLQQFEQPHNAGLSAGVVRLLELLEDEVQRCLGLLGVNNFAELDRTYLHAAAPANVPHVLSAFPLLKIEDYRY